VSDAIADEPLSAPNPKDTHSPAPVAIALIARAGRYLIRERPPLPGSPMPGKWEFPGGKCQPDEPPEACVRREIREEVGLAIQVDRLRRVIDHVYPHGRVLLHFFDCRLTPPDAEPDPSTGFDWVPLSDLACREFPGANDPIIAELLEEAGVAVSEESGLSSSG
jgi:mutator protein MutT